MEEDFRLGRRRPLTSSLPDTGRTFSRPSSVRPLQPTANTPTLRTRLHAKSRAIQLREFTGTPKRGQDVAVNFSSAFFPASPRPSRNRDRLVAVAGGQVEDQAHRRRLTEEVDTAVAEQRIRPARVKRVETLIVIAVDDASRTARRQAVGGITAQPQREDRRPARPADLAGVVLVARAAGILAGLPDAEDPVVGPCGQFVAEDGLRESVGDAAVGDDTVRRAREEDGIAARGPIQLVIVVGTW